MDHLTKKKVFGLVVGLSFGLMFMGTLRISAEYPNILTPLAGYATPGYVVITLIFTILFVHIGVPFYRFGFARRPDLRQIMLALAAIAILRVFTFALNPLIEDLFGPRNLERFSNVQGSFVSLVVLLIINWTLAAFGEEFTYRIVLMRTISFLFGDTGKGQIYALLLQTLLFGLIHAYQGPAGIVSSAFSGLVFGTVTIAARWSIWPAGIAHGTNNTIGIIALYYGNV